jgi:hypothetical protein
MKARVYLLTQQAEKNIRLRHGPFTCFTRNNKPMRGLTVCLSEKIFPLSLKRNFRQKGVQGGSSAKRGKTIGYQLMHIIDCPHGPACVCGQTPTKSKLSPLRAVLDILRTAKERGFKPVTTELGVCHATGNLATGCDLVLLNEATQEIIPVEIKSGTRSGPIDDPINPHRAKWISRGPFEKDRIIHSFRNRHLLQLLCTRRMLAITYPKVKVGVGYLVYPDRKNVEWIPSTQLPLSDERIDEVLDALVSS